MSLIEIKLFSALALLIALVGGFTAYHHHVFKQGEKHGIEVGKVEGKKQGRAEMLAEWQAAEKAQAIINRAKEAADLQHAEEKFNEYLQTKQALDVANSNLAAATVSLHNSIASYKRRLSEASQSTERTFDPRAAGADLLEECAARYSSMAQEAGRLSDKVNGLIDQVPH